MTKHNILVIEGAGAKMPLESSQIEYIETKMGKSVTQIFDLAVTTSSGTVIMSILATARMPCKDLNKLLLGNRSDSDRDTDCLLKKMFDSRGLRVPKYDRQTYIDSYKQHVGDPVYMKEAVIPFICTSVNECDGFTHFFKSWEDKDGNLRMTDAACRSFAAPYYFGEIVDQKEKAIWGDGGMGIFNLPLLDAYTQARVNGWLQAGHQVHILAICGGAAKYTVNFNGYKKEGSIGRLVRGLRFFMNPEEGGSARATSTAQQVRWLQFNMKSYDNLTFQYTNWYNMPDDLDAMDNWKARWSYYDKGMELAKGINLDILKK